MASISRDEAREIAAVAIMLAIASRIASGTLQAIDELGGTWTSSSVLGRLTAPIGTSAGMLCLGLALLIALSPSGSMGASILRTGWIPMAAVAILGAIGVAQNLYWMPGDVLGRVWFVLINNFPATLLAGSGWYIMKNLDTHR